MKPRTLILIALGALLLGLAGPGQAQAAKQPGITAINISPQIASDDDRYVAFQRRNGVPVVLDTWKGTFRALRGANYCQPRDIGGGRVLLICPHEKRRCCFDSGFRARTGSVAGGRTKRLARSKKLADAYEIGKYWLSMEEDFQHPGTPTVRLLNWRTGHFKSFDPDPFFAHGGVDLNSRRPRWAEVRLFDPRIKGAPDAYPDAPELCRSRDVVLSSYEGRVRLWWDPTHSVRLGPSRAFPDFCEWLGSPRMGRNWVTWSNGPTVHAYNFRTGESFKKRFGKKALITPFRDGVVVARKVKKFGRYYTAFRVRVIRLG